MRQSRVDPSFPFEDAGTGSSAILDELCAEAAAQNWFRVLPPDAIRPVIARLLIQIQSSCPLRDADLKTRAIEAIQSLRL